MRILIGAACIAVLTYVGYFFWGEYNQSRFDALAEESAVKSLQDFMHTCNRLTTNDPSYDEAYSKSLSNSERIAIADKCIAFEQTGKLP